MALTTTILVVRHAEKMAGSGDVDLSDKGISRANELARIAKIMNVSRIYFTDARRSRQTAEPTTRICEGQIYGPPSYQWARSVIQENCGKTVIVVGHSNTIPIVVQLLGGPSVQIDEDEFDKIILLRTEANALTTVQMRYGLGQPSESVVNFIGAVATPTRHGNASITSEQINPIEIITRELGAQKPTVSEDIVKAISGEDWTIKKRLMAKELVYAGNIRKLVEKANSSEGQLEFSPYSVPFIIGDPIANQDTNDAFFNTVFVGWDDDPDFVCTGVIVAPNVVLTAKHCHDESPNYIYTEKAFFPPRPNAYIRLTGESLVHPSLDLVLLKLGKDVDFEPARLAAEDSLTSVASVTVVGYGVAKEISASSRYGIDQGTRRRATVPIRSYVTTPEDAHKSQAKLNTEFILGGTIAGATCFGDSGGPCFVDTDEGWKLLGVTSGAIPMSLWESPDKACGNGNKSVRCEETSVRKWIIDGIVGLATH